MNEEHDPRDISSDDKWDNIFKLRRKHKDYGAYYTLHYYINYNRTKVLEAGNNRIIIHTCPIAIDKIISCYLHCKEYIEFDSLQLLDVINHAFNNYCINCDQRKDNKCPHWEDWVNGKPIVDMDDEPIKIKEFNSFYNLYEINNDRNKRS
ncbi:MAG: hypothetical protein ACLPVJ_20745 [Syntrophobacteraceae bacterium]